MLECTACNRQFFSTEALIQHTEAKHGKTTVHRGVRAWEDSRNQRGELTTGQVASACTYEVGEHCYNYDTEMWECELCYRQFYEKRDLEQHLNSGAHEADLYRCQHICTQVPWAANTRFATWVHSTSMIPPQTARSARRARCARC